MRKIQHKNRIILPDFLPVLPISTGEKFICPTVAHAILVGRFQNR
jgi:hypothetical protein